MTQKGHFRLTLTLLIQSASGLTTQPSEMRSVT